ncbi:peptidoglycan/LPS O-acetylase OafA/YrhL [Kaistia hirudinis]|uniref:Peptidoglycan/LPS O-acetylase OafA/YrhL n=1 Tax=Kaistia hirudinis TaxID=1293440 RepID=A0A840AM05_9HYPH|nr:peptidoglycan/LPS O-acetylase OafA/YrhL [Kaistia hirudinis]
MRAFASCNRHFAALDGWRGFCATMVALFHLEAYSHFRMLGIVRNAYLFVDFFFVLSGFVIAANYARDLREGFGTGRFMLLRLGRLYPLHLATLAFLVALECLPFVLHRLAPGSVPFSTQDRGIGSLVVNLLMLQATGIDRSLTWNFPSWSVSAELWTYLLFALVASALPASRLVRLLALVALAAPIILGFVSPRNMDATYDFGLIRAIGGFSAGVIGYALYQRFIGVDGGPPVSRTSWTGVEIGCVILVAVFVSVVGTSTLSLLGPAVFLLAVLIFSAEGGAVSALLRSRPALRLGVLSYSIYMVHVPVLRVLMMTIHTLERTLGVTLTTSQIVDGQRATLIGQAHWQGDLVTIGFLAAVVAIASFTYTFVETPARRWSRGLVERHLPVRMKARFEARDPALPEPQPARSDRSAA